MRSEAIGLLFALGGLQAATAADLQVRFTDANGEPVADAVVVARGEAAAGGGETKAATIDQIDKTYVPHVLAIEAGTPVSFPNSDDIRHHVYSFSAAKTFELPLYKGTPAEPVPFDEPGVVALGCNIHDFMRGYIYVTDSPLFAVSAADGVARIETLPAGTYRVSVWHPRLKDGEPPPRTIELAEGEPATLAVRLELKPGLMIQRPSSVRRRRY